MLADKKELNLIINTAVGLFGAENELDIVEIINTAEIVGEQVQYDNWNGGTNYYAIYLTINVDLFHKIQERQIEIESLIKSKIELIIRPYDSIILSQVYIIPKSNMKIDWSKIGHLTSQKDLLIDINYLKATLISASTNGVKIQEVNTEYQNKYSKVSKALKQLNIENPNPFYDLWNWYGRYSAGDLPQYKDRRIFIGEMFADLLNIIQDEENPEVLNVAVNLTGWDRIERSVNEIKMRLQTAKEEVQFQTVGLLCRETIISLAQAVYVEGRHPILDGVNVSKTDAKRMLEAYIAIELGGGSNELLRKYARICNDFANELTHKRTAILKDASLCTSATISLINLIGILEEKYIK